MELQEKQGKRIKPSINIMKVLFIFGTQPEAIKLAPLIEEYNNFKNKFKSKICVTAQHREMLDRVLTFF